LGLALPEMFSVGWGVSLNCGVMLRLHDFTTRIARFELQIEQLRIRFQFWLGRLLKQSKCDPCSTACWKTWFRAKGRRTTRSCPGIGKSRLGAYHAPGYDRVMPLPADPDLPVPADACRAEAWKWKRPGVRAGALGGKLENCSRPAQTSNTHDQRGLAAGGSRLLLDYFLMQVLELSSHFMLESFSHSAWVVAGLMVVWAKAGAVTKAAMLRATTVARDFIGAFSLSWLRMLGKRGLCRRVPCAAQNFCWECRSCGV